MSEFKGLNLSSKFRDIRHSLTMLVTNPDIMSAQLSGMMLPSAQGVPYHINPSDPEQVVVFKKIINMLFNIEKILQDLEKIEFSKTANLTELIAYAPKVARNLYRVINQVYEAIHLINNSNISIQAIFGPQLHQLKQKMGPLVHQLRQFTPSGRSIINQNWGQVLGNAFNLLPKERTTSEVVGFSALGHAIFHIPEYFKQLQTMLESGSLFPEADPSIDPKDPEYLKQKAKREKEANAFTANLDGLAIKSWAQGLGIEYAAAIAKLAGFLKDHTKTIVQIGIPTSKAAYLRLEEALLHFKRTIFPAIIEELETLEVTLGLKPGLLVEPALNAGNNYYDKLIKMVSAKIEEARAKANKSLGIKAFLHVTEDDADKLELKSEFKVGAEIAHLIDKPFLERA